MTDLAPDMAVSWINVGRGSYGFPIPIDAVVVRVCTWKVRIKVLLQDGRGVERLVDPSSLRPRYS